MNSIFKFSISSFLVCFCLLAVAQPAAEPIRTESSIPAEDIFIDDIVSKRLIIENRLLAQQPIREADLVWEKRIQRVIDTREKLNLAFRSQE